MKVTRVTLFLLAALLLSRCTSDWLTPTCEHGQTVNCHQPW